MYSVPSVVLVAHPRKVGEDNSPLSGSWFISTARVKTGYVDFVMSKMKGGGARRTTQGREDVKYCTYISPPPTS